MDVEGTTFESYDKFRYANMNDFEDIFVAMSKVHTSTHDCTIFDMIGNGSKETMHSAMISFLINPNSHEAGAYCLQEFMKLLPADRVGVMHEAVNKVILEYDLGPVIINEHPKGGRIDIYVEDAFGYVMAIENKIYASDQECQLLRYHNTLEDRKQPHTLVYLTLFGKTPSKYSLGSATETIQTPLSPDDVITLSYGKINNWLTAIKGKCNSSIAYNIEQYQCLIQKLIMKETVINTILSSGNNYSCAVKIAEYIEDCRIGLKRMFIHDLKEALSGFATNVIDDGKIVGLSIDLESNVKIDVLIDWRLYISCKEPDLIDVRLENGTWEYVGSYDEYNFHDCSSQVKRYLSTRNDGNPVVADVASYLRSKFRLKL